MSNTLFRSSLISLLIGETRQKTIQVIPYKLESGLDPKYINNLYPVKVWPPCSCFDKYFYYSFYQRVSTLWNDARERWHCSDLLPDCMFIIYIVFGDCICLRELEPPLSLRTTMSRSSCPCYLCYKNQKLFVARLRYSSFNRLRFLISIRHTLVWQLFKKKWPRSW